MAKILGIDYGTKRVGLAIGDEEQKIALPFDILENNDGFVGNLRRVIESEGIYRLVVGIPLNMSGGDSDKTRETQDFIDMLERNFNMPIITEDERLSSQLADQLFKDYGKKYDRDAVAAMLILQGYLDKIR